jgi:hypothetical protein
MPHLKCEACKIRFQTDGRRPSDVGEARCPGCDSLLEPPSRLTDLVGFQRARFDGDDSDFLTAVAKALTPPPFER